MVRLVVDEARKLRWPWMTAVLLAVVSLAPALAVTEAWSNAQRDPRNLFDFEAVLTLLFLDTQMLLHPLIFGILAAFVLQREYQNRTLQALLLVPWSRYDILTGKIVFVGLVSVLLVAWSLALAVVLGLVSGVRGFSWDQVASLGLPLFTGWFVGLPCLVAVLFVTMATRNLVAAVAFCFVAQFVAMAMSNSGDAAFFNPWSLPFALAATDRLLQNLGLDPGLVPRAWAVFVGFVALSLGGTYWFFGRTNADRG